MRLITLWMEKYKNLSDFRVDFENGHGLTMLIGNNGSGKSNVLELIRTPLKTTYKASKEMV